MKLPVLALCMMFSSVSFCQTLIVGSSKYNPPFISWINKDGQDIAYGYDVDFIQEVCRRLHEVCKIKPYRFDELFDTLQGNKVDLIISSIIVTEHRKEHFIFSVPYLESNAQYITTANSNLNKMSDIENKKVGAKQGTPYGDLAKIVTKNNSIIFYDSIDDMFIGLQNKEIDVCIMDYESAKYWMASNPDLYKYVGGKIEIGEGYAIMLNKNNTALRDKINQAILNMEDDGTFLKMYSQYFN